MTKEDYQELTRLLELTWRKRDGSTDQKMVDHCLKAHKYIRLDDMIVSVCDLKPTIQNVIWYDDTRADPGDSCDAFVFANRHNMPQLWSLTHRTQDLYIMVAYSGDKTGGKLASLSHAETPTTRPAIRRVTPDELIKINEAVEEVRQDYAKRLAAYYKRYGKTHVRSEGYWADR